MEIGGGDAAAAATWIQYYYVCQWVCVCARKKRADFYLPQSSSNHGTADEAQSSKKTLAIIARKTQRQGITSRHMKWTENERRKEKIRKRIK